jgi:glycerol uptake facilitator-like aquaporin
LQATAHLSGGQLNPAVTAALAAVGSLPLAQAAANIIAQVAGAILAAALLAATIPKHARLTLGSNEIAPGIAWGNALCGEIIMTFVLVSVVLETAVNSKSQARAQAPLAIGFAVGGFARQAAVAPAPPPTTSPSLAWQPPLTWQLGAIQVFCAHAVLLPIDGCSINPARSLGPAIVSGTWPRTFWVFVVGPLLGSMCAVPLHLFFRSDYDTLPVEDPVDLRASNSEEEAAPGRSAATASAAAEAPKARAPGGVQLHASAAGEAGPESLV